MQSQQNRNSRVSSWVYELSNHWIMIRFLVPWDPSYGVALKSNQKFIGYAHDNYATITLVSIPCLRN